MMNRNRPEVRIFEKPSHIRDYPVGPCYEAGYLVTDNAGWRTERPVVDADRCSGCFYCYLCCPEGALIKSGKTVEIDLEFCKGCGICARVCPRKAIAMEREDRHGG